VAVSGVSIDSRTLQVGEAFFAIVGHRLNGHAFLGDAAARGAACVVVHALPDEPPAHVPLVLVADTTRSLGRLAAWDRSKCVVTMVAAVHTEFLGTIEGVREEKAALVRALSPAGIAVLNADDPRVASMAREAKGRVVTFGRAARATVRIAGEATDTEAGFAFT